MLHSMTTGPQQAEISAELNILLSAILLNSFVVLFYPASYLLLKFKVIHV